MIWPRSPLSAPHAVAPVASPGRISPARLSRAALALAYVVACGASAGCSAQPPVNWAEGGAPLVLPQAEWDRDDLDSVSITRDGRVIVDGDEWLLLDAYGRIFDSDRDPVALLQADGRLTGTDQQGLGRIGVHNAAPPWNAVAWLRVARDGTAMAFDSQAQPVHLGTWQGCDGTALRTCTLVSHLVLLDALRRYGPPPPPAPAEMGVGVGFWY